MLTADVVGMVEYLNENLLLLGEADQAFVQGVQMLLSMDEGITSDSIHKIRQLYQQARALEIG